MAVKMTNAVRLPYRLAKGSEAERYKRAEICNKQVFNTIKNKAEGNLIKLDVIREALDSNLHRMITYVISEEERNGSRIAGGTIVLKSQFTNELSGYEVILPIQKDDTIHIQDLHIVMHEFRHLFDMINNPKINQRKISFSKFPDANFKMNYMDSIYNNKIYTTKKYDKYAITDAVEMLLAPFSKEEQVNVLQLLRYRLNLEYNAYKEASNIQRELKSLYGDRFDKEDYISVRKFKFPYKIRILEERLKAVIAEIRNKSTNPNDKSDKVST